MKSNKKKIINDPLYGFVGIYSDTVFELIENPIFQRLRHIKQLGLSHLVYPGALHTRFHHSIGAMHLMSLALNVLRGKGVPVSEEEYEAGLIAVLLHDIGHGPFSHSLEFTILHKCPHEALSLLLMEKLNAQTGGKLTKAIEIFSGKGDRHFLHQLVSGQLDADRLDYLSRDCFYTGVSEGTVAADRLIRMLQVVDNELVLEEKGIYSLEHFLHARRVMYWQVYLHKTAVGAEQMLIRILERAKFLLRSGREIFCLPSLRPFLSRDIGLSELQNSEKLIDDFLSLDDSDIRICMKMWRSEQDKTLSLLCRMLGERKLFRTELRDRPFEPHLPDEICRKIEADLGLPAGEGKYFLGTGTVNNSIYVSGPDEIPILRKDGRTADIREISDLPNSPALSKIVTKYYLCYPKTVYL